MHHLNGECERESMQTSCYGCVVGAGAGDNVHLCIRLLVVAAHNIALTTMTTTAPPSPPPPPLRYLRNAIFGERVHCIQYFKLLSESAQTTEAQMFVCCSYVAVSGGMIETCNVPPDRMAIE